MRHDENELEKLKKIIKDIESLEKIEDKIRLYGLLEDGFKETTLTIMNSLDDPEQQDPVLIHQKMMMISSDVMLGSIIQLKIKKLKEELEKNENKTPPDENNRVSEINIPVRGKL